MSDLLLVTIENNVVHRIFRCETSEQLESAFEATCAEYDVYPEKADFDNGFIEHHNGSICMTSSDNWMDVVSKRITPMKVE